MQFNSILKELRLELGYTQSELAKKAKLATSCIAMLETNKREPNANTLIALSVALGVTTDYLLGLEDDFGIKKNDSAFVPSGYTKEEQQLIENYRGLNPACKKLVKQTVETLIASSAAGGQNKDAE